MSTPQEPLFLALQHLLEEDGSVSIGELLDRAGEQTYGFAILLLGLLTFIPAVANVVNLATLALGYQLFRRRPHPWIPERLQRYEMHRGRIKGLLAQVERYVRLLGSRHTPRRRMEGRGLGLLVAWTGFLAALPVILPAANILPAIAIVLIGVALLEEWPFLAWLGGAFSFVTTIYFAVSFQQILHWGMKAFQALKGVDRLMRFDVLTLLPEYFQAATLGVTGRAFRELGHGLHLHSYRPFSGNTHGHVDAPPYGGGPGMVLRPEVLQATLAAVPRVGRSLVVHFSPAAPALDHAAVVDLAGFDQLILVCSRFEGVDQRAVAACIDREYRVGEVVLSGGELPALILMDAVARWLPGVLGNAGSAEADSFATGLLDHPHFTRPEVFEGQGVPDVLLGGNHEAIRLWRLREAMVRTRDRRPDLWAAFLEDRLPGLSRSDQWCAWQVLHPEAWDQPKPKGWKGFKIP